MKTSSLNEIGELFIGGVQLADCYLNDEQKTKEKFICDSSYGRYY